MQILFFKIDKIGEVKDYKKCPFTYFSTKIFARTERKTEHYCKVKHNNLSFWGGELMR